MENVPRINAEKVVDYIVSFLRDELQKLNAIAAVFELSGEMDSYIVSNLCKMAIGRDNTYGIILPYKDTPKDALDNAFHTGRILGIRYLRFNITSQIDYYFRNFPQADRERKEDKMARERMSILYDLSSHFNGVVVGTVNKSKLYLGYGTSHGNFAFDLNPIGDLYKTQIYQVAEYLKIPQEIGEREKRIEKEAGREITDEIDLILHYHIDRGLVADEIIKTKGLDAEKVKNVLQKVKATEFMRKLPPIAKIPDEVKYG